MARFCVVIWEGRARGQKGHHTRGFFILRVKPEGFSPSHCWLSHILAIKLTRVRLHTLLPLSHLTKCPVNGSNGVSSIYLPDLVVIGGDSIRLY